MIKLIKNIHKDSLFKNSVYLMITIFTNLILGFFFWVIASKYYTPNDIGIISAILSSVSLISMISSVGFPTALLFYLPRVSKNSNKIIDSCLMVSIIISIIFSIIFIFGLDIWEPLLRPIFDSIELIAVFIIVTVMTTVSALMSGVFIAERKSSFAMIKENIFMLVKIFPLITFVGFGVIGIFISWCIGLLAATLIGFILLYITRKYTPKFTIDPIIKNIARYSVGNYIAGIFNNLPKLLLPIMIVSLISAEHAGYFFIAMTMAGLLYGISQSISSSLLAESFKGDIWENVSKAVRFNLFLLIPGLLLFIIFGKFILNIFNPSYAENATTTLIILAMASVPLSAINIFTTVRNVQKKVGSTIKINVIVAIITLILAIPLMKILIIEGAALAYLIGNTVGAIIVIIRIKNPIEFTIKLLRKKKDVVSI